MNDRCVLEGPDLNCSRVPLDKKLYRQIILAKNGLRAVLISDTVAMNDSKLCGNCDNNFDSDDESHSDMDDEDGSCDEEDQEEIRKAAAAMVVGVGSYFDPSTLQGLR